MPRGTFHPGGAHKVFVELFHAKDQVGHTFADGGPHAFVDPHAFAFVLNLRIKLGIAGETDRAAEMIHGEEVIFPGRIDDFQQNRSLQATHLGPVPLFYRTDHDPFQFRLIQLAKLVCGERTIQLVIEPISERLK